MNIVELLLCYISPPYFIQSYTLKNPPSKDTEVNFAIFSFPFLIPQALPETIQKGEEAIKTSHIVLVLFLPPSQKSGCLGAHFALVLVLKAKKHPNMKTLLEPHLPTSLCSNSTDAYTASVLFPTG